MMYAAIIISCVYLLWVHYVAVMHLKHMLDDGIVTTAQKVLGYPALAVGLVLDLAVNVVVCTGLFLELPREWTVSGRLWRLSNGADGWRKSVALALRVGLLDSADPSGIHKG
jgi:hypothetical protein